MRKLLQVAHQRAQSGPLSMPEYQRLARCYVKILDQGRPERPKETERAKGQRGRLARSDALNRLERFAAYRKNTLRFTRRAEVPFTKNRAEPDRRLDKVKQNVAGCFRTVTFAQNYCRISSYLKP